MMMGFRFKSWADAGIDLGVCLALLRSGGQASSRPFQAVRGLEHEEQKSLFASFQFDLIDDELQY